MFRARVHAEVSKQVGRGSVRKQMEGQRVPGGPRSLGNVVSCEPIETAIPKIDPPAEITPHRRVFNGGPGDGKRARGGNETQPDDRPYALPSRASRFLPPSPSATAAATVFLRRFFPLLERSFEFRFVNVMQGGIT